MKKRIGYMHVESEEDSKEIYRVRVEQADGSVVYSRPYLFKSSAKKFQTDMQLMYVNIPGLGIAPRTKVEKLDGEWVEA